MGKFNLMELLNAQAERDAPQASDGMEAQHQKPAYEIAALSVHSLVPSEGNFYSMAEIEKLKRDIELAGGVKQNLTVTPLDAGRYKILSGHRRCRACLELVQEGKPEYEFIPCGIEPPQPDKEMQAIREELLIITTNSQREKTDWDRVQETKHLHDVLQRYKAHGGKLPGRVREIIADTLNTSAAQIGRMGAIAKNLIPEFQEEMKEKRLGISAAYELSGLSEEQQRAAYAEHQEKGGLSVSDAKQRKGGDKQKPHGVADHHPAEPAPPKQNTTTQRQEQRTPPSASSPVEREQEPAPLPPWTQPHTFTEFKERQQRATEDTVDNTEATATEPETTADEIESARLEPNTLEEAKNALARLENNLLPYCISMAEAYAGGEGNEWELNIKAVLAAMAELQRRVFSAGLD